MFTDQLKEHTHVDHQQLEKLLINKMRAVRTPQDYVGILQLFYGYFGALEDRINQFINKQQLPDYNTRRKTEALKEDITALGGVTAKKAQVAELPSIDNNLQAFGALYVIEGSTLGGSIISKMMAKQLGLDQSFGGFSFFNGYGDDTNTKWNYFKEALNHQASSPEGAHTIMEAANQTFSKFKNWIETNG